MKIISYISLMLFLGFFACSGTDKQTVKTEDAKAVDSIKVAEAKTVELDLEKSTLAWEGSEGFASIVKSHNGTFVITKGSLSVKENQLVGGSFEIDINTLKVLDIKDAASNAKLTNHLKSADFFESDKFPKATFEVVSAEKSANDSTKVTGNLTLKGVKKSVVFPAKIEITDKAVKANAKFYINRKYWGMFYRTESSLGDEFIRPEVGIDFNIITK
jgi:polyisoprenoid-binding protein YceI